MRCLVTGATGYIGGRLVPRLLAAGHEVRCLARDPARLRDAPWSGDVETVRGDVLDEASLVDAMRGVDVVHYLVHSLRDKDFVDTDRRAAGNVARAAEQAGVRRVVYLGGLHPAGTDLSPHLASRTEVGEIFLRGLVPAAVLQAAVIIGSGSASFEMLRHLTERLPVMVTPRWVHNRIQPIAVRDVLHYLVGCVDLPDDVNRTFDIGGPDVLTYLDMMQRYAQVAGLRRRFVLPVPLLTPRLSSHWVNAVTPVPRSIASPLIESLVNEVVCGEHDIDRYVPAPERGLTGYDRAVSLAIGRTRAADVETRWSDASWTGAPSDPLPTDPDWSGGSVYTDHRDRDTTASPQRLWAVGHRRRERVVLVPTGLGRPRLGGPADRRRRPAARPARPAAPAHRRGTRLVARRGHRTRFPAAPAGRDEAARPRLARAAGAARRRWRAVRPARCVRAARAGRSRLLVAGVAVPRAGVRRHGPQHHQRGGTCDLTRRLTRWLTPCRPRFGGGSTPIDTGSRPSSARSPCPVGRDPPDWPP